MSQSGRENSAAVASAAANAASGNYISAGISLIKGLFGGGGSESSVAKTLTVSGNFTPGGFTGNVIARDQLGNSWDATAFNSPNDLVKAYAKEYNFLGNIPVNFTVPYVEQGQIPLGNAVKSIIESSATKVSNAVSNTIGSGSSSSGGGGGGGGGGNSNAIGGFNEINWFVIAAGIAALIYAIFYRR